MSLPKSYITTGFKEDCEKLITCFNEVNDIRFETFCDIWKNMKFSHVFTHHQTIPETFEFCEEALHIAKQFLLLSIRFKERIGGLYLLYGVYYKMPTNRFKIRLKLDDWKNIMDFHDQIKEGEHLDANYILSKLIIDNAFHYCIFDREYGLEKYFRAKKKQSGNPYSILPALKDMTNEDQLLSQILDLSRFYEEQKDKLCVNSMDRLNLNFYTVKGMSTIIKEIQDFDANRRNLQLATFVKETKDDPKSNQQSFSKFKTSTLNKVRSKVGHGFDTDTSESEGLSSEEEDYDESLSLIVE